MGKRWTDEEINLLKKLKEDGLSESEIASHFNGRTMKSINMKAFKLGFQSPPPEDLTGKTFGRWHVIKLNPHKPYEKSTWDCICECQMSKPESEREHHAITSNHLKSGVSKSCGCLSRELATGRSVNKKYNRYEERDGYMVGYTFKGEEFYFDKSDFELIKPYCWAISRGYVVTVIPSTMNNGKYHQNLKMHRLIMEPDDWDHNNNEVDHINGIRCDNRRSNLRIVTHGENMKNVGFLSSNKSGYKGVSYIQRDDLWVANIRVDGKQYSEYYHTKDKAIEARKRLEKEYYGEFARAPENLFNTNGEVSNPIE